MVSESLEIELKKRVFRKSYFEFFKWGFSILMPNEKYEDNFHIKYLCDRLQQEVERILRRESKDKDIIINVPPRTSKSLLVNVLLMPWVWSIEPTIPFISISFDDELTLLNAQYAKDIVKSEEYQELFGHLFQIRGDADSKGFFMNDKGGFRMSKTTGANITGHKGMIIIVDDPQNPKTAESAVHRKGTIAYYTNSLYNRLTPVNLGVRIIIMQRLHEEDLTGYLLANDPESYEHICLPAEISDHIKPKELVKFYQDGLLDPRRLSKPILASFRKTLGSRGFAGQYGQIPSPDEGGIFKKEWFDIVMPEYVLRNESNSPIHFFIDGAYTDKTENDPSSILTCFESEGFLYVLDSCDQWLEFPALCKFIGEHTKKFRITDQSKIFIEPKASGKSVAQYLRATTNLNIIETVAPDKSKITRAHAVTPKCESRRVRLVNGPYVKDLLDQLGAFPNALHDDKVDTLVMGINELLPANNNPDILWLG